MANPNWTWSKRIDLPSDPRLVTPLIEELLKQLRKLGYSDRDIFGVHLSVEEALVNAIRHGNHGDPGKTVRVFFGVTPEQARIEIEDQGPGFVPADVPDCTDDAYIDRPCGRGLLLMKNFMNDVAFNDCGNAVMMVKRRTSSETR